MLPTLEKKQIELDIIIKDLTLAIDINLVEQVLINLLINAVEAVKDNEEPRIVLSAEVQNNNIQVQSAEGKGSVFMLQFSI